MKTRHTITTVALAGAMSLGALATGAAAASASTGTRAHQDSHRRAGEIRATTATRASRSIEDATFRMTRVVESPGGAERVVFYATDLRTGRTTRLN